MTTHKEALTLALEALEEAWYHVGTFQPTEKAIDLYEDARAAIKEALAQPEQEPVAWYIREKDSATTDGCWAEKNLDICEPLYTTPPQRTWVGLTDEDVVSLCREFMGQFDKREFIKATEFKLKEKNT